MSGHIASEDASAAIGPSEALEMATDEAERLEGEDRERFVESYLHQIAACIHKMLSHRKVTAAELRVCLIEIEGPWSARALDSLLAAKPGKGGLRLIGVIAWLLHFDLDFKVSPRGDETEHAAIPLRNGEAQKTPPDRKVDSAVR